MSKFLLFEFSCTAQNCMTVICHGVHVYILVKLPNLLFTFFPRKCMQNTENWFVVVLVMFFSIWMSAFFLSNTLFEKISCFSTHAIFSLNLFLNILTLIWNDKRFLMINNVFHMSFYTALYVCDNGHVFPL